MHIFFHSILFQPENFDRVSNWQLLRHNLDLVNKLKWMRDCDTCDTWILNWRLEPGAWSLNWPGTWRRKGERTSSGEMVSKTSSSPLLILLLVSKKSSDSGWLMPAAILMFHAAISRDWCLLSTYNFGDGHWSRLIMLIIRIEFHCRLSVVRSWMI